MDREHIRDLTRMLADELTEAPEGLMSNDNLNTLINISQNNVVLRLAPAIPYKFRKNTTFNTTADKGEYDISSDIGISNCLRITDILHNLTSERPVPLIYVPDVEDKWQYGEVGETGNMKYWGYDSDSEIWIRKIPASSEADRLKAYYIEELSDLSADGDTPSLPSVTHQLIAYDVLYYWCIRGAPQNLQKVKSAYQIAQQEVLNTLDQNFSIEPGLKPSVKELTKRNDID